MARGHNLKTLLAGWTRAKWRGPFRFAIQMWKTRRAELVRQLRGEAMRTVFTGFTVWALIIQTTLAFHLASSAIASADSPGAAVICLSSGKKSSQAPASAATRCQQCLNCVARADLIPPLAQTLCLPQEPSAVHVGWSHEPCPAPRIKHGLPAARAPPGLSASA